MTLMRRNYLARKRHNVWQDALKDFLRRRIPFEREEPEDEDEDVEERLIFKGGLSGPDPSGSMTSAEFNQATDMVINDLLMKAGFVLPGVLQDGSDFPVDD